ncbi:ADP-ribosylation factor-like protein 6-interacting protein 1 [Fopius arisanus]|uniref:ADP-ribosylation factor-like protein 6-interacting protein 1 n=1 Tax=Fopius arisanus TaxID=64838 RepID=A0A9R1TGS8_9HYME|nr:PREDICTED: ADP-ribosylation factor-like protein 6-interacting protein 1 [Fopius arisanus]
MPDSEKEKCMKQLKRRMEAWREVVLPINSVMLWEKTWYPGLILGVTTTLFLFIWMLEPAFVTIISISLLLAALIDYLVPVLSSTFISSSAWTGQKEKKLEEICQNLSEIIIQGQNARKYLLNARSSRPMIYYGSITLGLSLLAWLGNIVNNLLLMYLIVNTILLLPGLKHKGRVQSGLKHAYKYLLQQKKA